jgi:hypothetical protein
MPWFKIDDSAYSHPKFVRAGNAALGLWLRCGAYSAQHLLEGHIPGFIAKAFGTDPQAAKLVKVGLWHAGGHDCPRCPQPAADGYMIHDFFEGGRNSTRAQVEAARQAATDRQAKARAAAAEGAKKQKAPSNRTLNRVGIEVQSGSESAANRTPNDTHFQDSTAGHNALSQRDGLNGVTPSHAAAAPHPVLPNGSTAAATAPTGVPDALAELKHGIASAGLTAVGWDLTESQWEYTRQTIHRVGVATMVAFAVNSARLKGQPAGASAWVKGWRTLEAAPQQTGVSYLPAVAGDPFARPQTTSEHNASVLAAFRARHQEQQQ